MKLLTLGLCFSLSFLLVFILMPGFIKFLKRKNLNQEVSEYALQEFKDKQKTPIMGGFLFMVAPLIVILILKPKLYLQSNTAFVLLSFFLTAAIGFVDDVLILVRHNNEGLRPKLKLALQFLSAVVVYIIFKDIINTTITFPLSGLKINLGYFYLPFMVLVYGFETNAVNFTDGMDGLCAGVSLFVLVAFGFVCYQQFDDNLFIVICFIGSLLAYLYYNHFPAQIFMGDTGSLGLGGLFASLGIILNKEIFLLVAGLVFVIEMLCVCLQLFSVIVFKRRIFSYTPIHYAFKLKGMSERSIVSYFSLASFICAVLAILMEVI